jgi:hypothetical protein
MWVHPTKRQVSIRQVSKRPVSKRLVSKRRFTKRQVYKTSGFKTSGFKTSRVHTVSSEYSLPSPTQAEGRERGDLMRRQPKYVWASSNMFPFAQILICRLRLL